jgi:hypothetical protein
LAPCRNPLPVLAAEQVGVFELNPRNAVNAGPPGAVWDR